MYYLLISAAVEEVSSVVYFRQLVHLVDRSKILFPLLVPAEASSDSNNLVPLHQQNKRTVRIGVACGFRWFGQDDRRRPVLRSTLLARVFVDGGQDPARLENTANSVISFFFLPTEFVTATKLWWLGLFEQQLAASR